MLQEITLRAIDDFFQPIGASTVDQLGVIDRQIKELEAAARKLKDKLLESGAGQYYGKHFSAEVQEYDRNTISATLVKQHAHPDFLPLVTQVQHVKAVVVKPID
jgi:hypothetical protein